MSTTDCDVDPFSCVFSLASTSGLLLPATEVQLLLDVLESLKKFVVKSFRNKDEFLLFNEGKSMAQLMELIIHDHDAVQIAAMELLQAMMPIGWEVGVERMRSVPATVTNLIQILAPLDAEPTVHEIGFFCLMRYLRNDAKSVMAFCERGGVPLLLSFLKIDNFDVLGLVLQCLYWITVPSLISRVEMMDAKIFVDYVVEFCTSPIDEIQSVTCDIVLLLSQLRKLRNKLRCVGVLEKICGIILDGEIASNLQVRLLEIVANCLTDEVANIQFAQGMGMFSWSFDVVAEKEAVVRWDRTFALSLRLLAIFADLKENRRTLRDLGVETPTIKLMTTKSGHVLAAGLQLIMKLSDEEDCREVFGQLGAISKVLDYLLDRKPVASAGKSVKSIKTTSTKSTGKAKSATLKSTTTAGVSDAETIVAHEINFDIGTACLAALSAASRANSDLFFLPENLNRLVDFLKSKFPEVGEDSEVAALNVFDALRNLVVDAEGFVDLFQKADLIEITISYLESRRDRRLVVGFSSDFSFTRPKLGDLSICSIISAVQLLAAFYEIKKMMRNEDEIYDELQSQGKSASIREDFEDFVGDDSQLTPEMLERRRRLHALIIELLTSENVNVVVGGAKLIAALAKWKSEGSALIRADILALLWRRKDNLAEMFSRSQNHIIQTCLQRILECELSLKYCLLGRLGALDVIGEKFYDIGAKKGVEEALEVFQKDFSNVKHNWREIVGIEKGQQKRMIVETIPTPALTPAATASSLQQQGSSSSQQMPAGTASSLQQHRSSISLQIPAAGIASAVSETERGSVLHEVSREQSSRGSPISAMIQIVRQVDEDIDPTLCALIHHVQGNIAPLPTLEDQIRCLGILVCYQHGGPMPVNEILPSEVENSVQNLKKEKNTDRLFIGEIQYGAAHHRSLLFKVLSDELAIPCSLVRGEYFRCWNEVWMTQALGWIFPTDNLRWLLHHSVNSEETQKEEIPILTAFDDLPSVVTKDAPPDSLTVSLAMAMAIQTQFLKILLVDDKTANEVAVQRESLQIEEMNGSFIERVCDCPDHQITQCFCCPLCPGWRPSDLAYPSSTQTAADDEVDDPVGCSKSCIPKKFVVDVCFQPGKVISELDERRIRSYTHF